MKIVFDHVELEGFRSAVNPISFNLNRAGLNLVKGINGAGKTTIFEGVVWTIYGNNLKDTNQDKIPSWPETRNNSWQGTRTAVYFDVNNQGYRIIRHLNYKGLTEGVRGEDYLMLFKGDNLVGNFRNKTEIQEEINRLMGMDSRTFLAAVLFGQRLKKLVESENKDKRELFETLFETEWITTLKTKCDKDISEKELEASSMNYQMQTITNTIESQGLSLEQAKTMLAGWEEARQVRLQAKTNSGIDYTNSLINVRKNALQLTKELKALKYDSKHHDQVEADYNTMLKQVQDEELAQKELVGKINLTNSKVEQWERELKRTQEAYKKLKAKHIEENCPYCEQELLPGNKLEVNHNKELAEAKNAVDLAKTVLKEGKKAQTKLTPVATVDHTDAITELYKAVEDMNSLYDQYEKTSNKLELVNRQVEQLEKDIARVTSEIESIKAEKPPVIDVKKIETTINEQQDKLKQLQQDKLELDHKLEIARWWSSKALSSSGLKAYIFTSMLGQLNQNVKKYGQQLGVSLEFSIDLSKASKPFMTTCSIGDKLNKDYKEFSGGQKQKLDIALIFAMFDLISMNADMNILIMDEVFEGLSEDGEAAVFDLIRGKAQEGKSVYVITHSAVLDSLYANTIQLENVNGNTVIN